MTLKNTAYLLAVFFIITSCKTTEIEKSEYISDSGTVEWHTIEIPEIPAQTVQIIQQENKNSKWACIKINLSATKLQLSIEPNENYTTKSFYLKKFSQTNHTIVAMNTVPFKIENKTFSPVGILKVNGKIISDPNPRYSCLCFKITDEKLKAEILENQNSTQISQYDYAFGGFFPILSETEVPEYKKIRHSRTAVGISDGGNILYLFAGTGKNSFNDNKGFTYEECASIMKKLGCQSAMTFDGGHSTGLTLGSRNVIKPLFQRKVPAAFGIKFP